MQGSLGEKIGEGAFADVHAWAPGQVVKLFKPGVRRRTGLYEARMTQAVFAAGGPAPEVLGEVMVDGRFGFLLRRLDGPTLLQRLRTGAVTSEQAAAILASVGISVHRTPPPLGAPTLRDYMAASLEGREIADHIATGVLALIDRLPPPDGLCHGDLHLDNVIMTAEGPRLIDWTGAMRSGAAHDLAVSHLLLTEILPASWGDRESQGALDVAVQCEYARQAGISLAALTKAMKAYVPIVCVFVLLGGWARPALRERMIQRIEADLRAAG